MNRIALITGGTGLLGVWLTRELALNGFRKIYLLARRKAGESTEVRVRTSLTMMGNHVSKKIFEKIVVLEGELCDPKLRLPSKVMYALERDRVTDIFHVAALVDFRRALTTMRIANVRGTEHICGLASLLRQRTGLSPWLHHISTVAVAGDLKGWFKETQLSCGQRFHNSYEQSKYEAEQVLLKYREKGSKVSIYRPGIMTGDSQYGITTNFKMMYQPLHFLAMKLFQELPGDGSCVHSLVPVDKVAEAICLLSTIEQTPNAAWHLVGPDVVRLDHFIDVASHVFRFKKPTLIPLEDFPHRRLSQLQWKLFSPFVPYFNYKIRFDASEANTRLARLGFKWPCIDRGFLEKLFRYCVRCGYIRR